MKVVIVFNHPYEGSYCNAILQSVVTGLHRAGHATDLIHLDKEEFDPVMRAKDLEAFVKAKYNSEDSQTLLDPKVLEYRDRLQEADHLIFIFPIWWELMPAMTKGFIDKVIFPGIAYHYENNGKKMVKEFLRLKGITLITTMNTPSFLYRVLFGNAIRYAFFTGTFWKLGYKNRKWISLDMVKFVSDQKRKKWLTKLESHFGRMK
ncbi:NAD(P)H-dependent oxidoreductase [Xanthocytophaga flava]|uniref:NAD(P)H-dependent oxidoreductase n=1 Tax=Xanthocytophaga flava TaxID=3048013 RepID=UPI0028D74539|nr:NAD(P)H-dependent oxidoreductase [Xanthocytophaga flavus]MDJ1469659.1 NAD(P)H-dependent oxidoreductase [Xanthocytophaga flavus]